MSKEENRGMIDAYQKMLNDGTAFKEVDTTMLTSPSLAEAEGAGLGRGRDSIPDVPLGDKIETPEREYHNDYSENDSIMEQKMASLRAKMGKGKPSNAGGGRIAILERKVKRLEEALTLVMETHEKLLG